MKLNVESATLPPPTGTLRERQRAAAADLFLEAAGEVFAAHGYEKATMKEIARAAGCTAGTIYLYFRSKEELFQTILERHLRECAEDVRAAQASAADPLEALRAGVATMVARAETHRGFYRVFYEAAPFGRAHAPVGLSGVAADLYRAARDRDLEVLREAQRAGLVRTDLPAEELAALVASFLYATFARWTTSPDAPPFEERFHVLWGFLAAGLGARSTRR